MKKYLGALIFILLLLSSCELALGGSIPPEHNTPVQSVEYVTLDCIDTFSINGKGYTTVKASLPVIVYNPNLYNIDVMVNGSAILTLLPHEENELK